MTRQVRWYRKVRAEVIEALGGICEECHGIEELEIHHPGVKGYVTRDISRWQRAVNWRRELARGELRLLCKPCNRRRL